MPEFKEKPGPGKRGKARPPSAALPRQAARQMKERPSGSGTACGGNRAWERLRRGTGGAGRALGCEGIGRDSRPHQAGPEAGEPPQGGGPHGPGGRAGHPGGCGPDRGRTAQRQPAQGTESRGAAGPGERASWQQRRRPKVQAGPWAQGAAGSQRAGHNTHKARTPAGFWHTTGPQPFRQGRIATRPFPLEQPSARLCRVTPGREQRRPGGRAARLRQSSPPEHTKGSGTQTGRRSRKAHPPRI